MKVKIDDLIIEATIIAPGFGIDELVFNVNGANVNSQQVIALTLLQIVRTLKAEFGG